MAIIIAEAKNSLFGIYQSTGKALFVSQENINILLCNAACCLIINRL